MINEGNLIRIDNDDDIRWYISKNSIHLIIHNPEWTCDNYKVKSLGDFRKWLVNEPKNPVYFRMKKNTIVPYYDHGGDYGVPCFVIQLIIDNDDYVGLKIAFPEICNEAEIQN